MIIAETKRSGEFTSTTDTTSGFGLVTSCERTQPTTTKTNGYSDECGAMSAGIQLSEKRLTEPMR
jgi:hypothetical protein